MSKKLIFIIISIFIAQYALFTFIEVEVKPEEEERRSLSDFEAKYGIALKENGQPYNSFIDLSNQNLSEIPEEVYTFQNIESIDLSGNDIWVFPYRLLELPRLKTIKINENELQELDFSNINNRKLQVLEVKGNRISDIDSLENLSNLSYINLSYNNLYFLPYLTGDALKIVNLSDNPIRSLVGKIGNNLAELNLASNAISTVNIDMEGDEMISELNLNDNPNLENFPYEVLEFPNLKTLRLTNCNIKSINEQAFFRNNELERLYLSDNQISDLVIKKGDFEDLTYLDLSDNGLEKVSIESENIEFLLLRNNQLIYENLFLDLEQAIQINLSNNSLTDLPKRLINVPNTVELNLHNNLMEMYKVKKQLNVN